MQSTANSALYVPTLSKFALDHRPSHFRCRRGTNLESRVSRCSPAPTRDPIKQPSAIPRTCLWKILRSQGRPRPLELLSKNVASTYLILKTYRVRGVSSGHQVYRCRSYPGSAHHTSNGVSEFWIVRRKSPSPESPAATLRDHDHKKIQRIPKLHQSGGALKRVFELNSRNFVLLYSSAAATALRRRQPKAISPDSRCRITLELRSLMAQHVINEDSRICSCFYRQTG